MRPVNDLSGNTDQKSTDKKLELLRHHAASWPVVVRLLGGLAELFKKFRGNQPSDN